MNSKVFFLSVLALVGCSKSGPAADAGDEDKKPTVTVQLQQVKLEPVSDYVSLQGSFSPSEGGIAKLAPALASRIGRVFVKEGDLVKRGQLLATLDPSVAAAQESSARAAANAAEIQAQQSTTNLEVSKADQSNLLLSASIALQQARSEGASSVAQARYTLIQSQADLEKLKLGPRPQEIAQAHEVTVQATATRNRAQSELDRDEALSADGYIAKRQLDDARTALETANSAVAAAQDSEQLVRTGTRPEEIRSAEAKTASAQAALTAAEKAAALQITAAHAAYAHAQNGSLQVVAKEQDLATSKAAAAQKLADLQATKATVSLYRIVAPFDGIILKRAAAAGDPADPAVPVLFVQRKGARTNFVATGLPDQISELSPGMSAIITAGDQKFDGEVLSISPADTAGGLASVRISIGGSPASGLAGVARIVTQRHSGLPTVPDAAIVEKDGKEIVFKNVKGVATQTEVKIGPELNGRTAVLSGLKAGDSIVATGGNELDDGTKISAEAPAGESKEKD